MKLTTMSVTGLLSLDLSLTLDFLSVFQFFLISPAFLFNYCRLFAIQFENILSEILSPFCHR